MKSIAQFFGQNMKDINDNTKNWMAIHNSVRTKDHIFEDYGIFCSIVLDKSKRECYNSDVFNKTPNKELK